MPSMTQCANGSRRTAAAAMRARTCDSTPEDMFRDSGERPRLARGSRNLTGVPAESHCPEVLANFAMLRERGVELHDQRMHGRVAQRALHARDDLVLESIYVNLDVRGD